ncbi:TatD family hydrolase [Marinoscillum luteum]|jgi:TatD DNase family protein|uniref:TatD family hydrolase n=1 Tax=Marinoscillum luteum TaxID=861051 RepID=A0ABW7NC16_9BACT
MILVDSHAHIYTKEFKADIEEVISRAREAGVDRIYMPNIDHESIEDMLELALKYPGFCVPMMGLHPCSVKKDFEKQLYEVEEFLSKGGFCAVGEMGTDLYWDKTLFEEQKEAFRIQCELAIRHQLPIVIHCRESIDETIALVKPYADRGLTGVFHCFTGTLEQANEVIDLNFKLGLGGVATFKNGGMEPVIRGVALEHILLETDSPYLAPTPHRGKRNEPAYTKIVAQKIAEILDREVAEIGEITSQNSKTLFR